jgi:hypothetical protein
VQPRILQSAPAAKGNDDAPAGAVRAGGSTALRVVSIANIDVSILTMSATYVDLYSGTCFLLDRRLTFVHLLPLESPTYIRTPAAS